LSRDVSDWTSGWDSSICKIDRNAIIDWVWAGRAFAVLALHENRIAAAAVARARPPKSGRYVQDTPPAADKADAPGSARACFGAGGRLPGLRVRRGGPKTFPGSGSINCERAPSFAEEGLAGLNCRDEERDSLRETLDEICKQNNKAVHLKVEIEIMRFVFAASARL